jgi:hypothetical protein
MLLSNCFLVLAVKHLAVNISPRIIGKMKDATKKSETKINNAVPGSSFTLKIV